jgi:hypothetical protein
MRLGMFLGCLAAVGCADLKATRRDSDHLRQSSDQIEQNSELMKQTSAKLLEQSLITNKGVHLQTLNNALTGMLTYGFNPPLLAPFAKTFGEEATTKEITDLLHVLFMDAFKLLNVKSYLAAASLSSLLPDDKFQTILTDQMEHKGAYQDVALKMIGARWAFIKIFRYEPLVKDKHFTNGSLGLGVQFVHQLKVIALLPYLDQVEVYTPLPAKIDPKEVDEYVKQVRALAAEKCDLKDPEVQKLLDSL